MSGAAELLIRLASCVAGLRQQAEADGHRQTVTDLDRITAAAELLGRFLGSLPERLAKTQTETDRRSLRHDLRTPINQIVGYCELLQEEHAEGGDGLLPALAQLHDITLALRDAVEAAAPTDQPPPTAKDTGSFLPTRLERTEARILVVDDNPTNRDMLGRRLQRDGFEVVTAHNGVQALEKIHAESVDVVLLDIMMPVMDGYATLEQLKSDPALRHIPVIMLTSLHETDSIARCIQKGAEDHLPKPFDPVLLRARIGASLEKKRLHDLQMQYLAQIKAEKQRVSDLLDGVIPIGVALSGERDFNRLLERIVEAAQRFCGADGGALMLRKADDTLEPVVVRCDSLGLGWNGKTATADPPLSPIPLLVDAAARSPAAEAAVRERTIHVADAAAPPPAGLDLQSVSRFDEAHRYRTQTLLALPLRPPSGAVIGTLQLWNGTDPTTGDIVGFEHDRRRMLESLSSLAAVALQSYSRETALRETIQRLEIAIDDARKRRDVSEITETDYFKQLRDKARTLRQRADSTDP